MVYNIQMVYSIVYTRFILECATIVTSSNPPFPHIYKDGAHPRFFTARASNTYSGAFTRYGVVITVVYQSGICACTSTCESRETIFCWVCV
jgi:hypothetical protein